MIFSASMTPASIAAATTSLEIIRSEPFRRTNLLSNTDMMRIGLQEAGFNTGNSETPIIPIIIGANLQTMHFWKELIQAGIYTNPIISPAVSEGHELIRTSFIATQSQEQLKKALITMKQIGEKVQILKEITTV